MGQRHLRIFPVDNMCVQGSLVIGVLFLRLHSLAGSLGNKA